MYVTFESDCYIDVESGELANLFYILNCLLDLSCFDCVSAYAPVFSSCNSATDSTAEKNTLEATVSCDVCVVVFSELFILPLVLCFIVY